MNDLASLTGKTLNFMGVTLDGSAETIDNAVNRAIDALGSDTTGSYGVMLSKFGDGLTAGVDSYADSADSAIRTMAKSQVKILDALIQMFEAIVAMEDFEKVDLDLDGILDFGEIFSDTDLEENATKFTAQFTSAAQILQDKLGENSEIRAAFEAVKINGYSMASLIDDAVDGVRNIDISAQDYSSAVSVLYEMAKRGDFDINNIAQSLREQLVLNHRDFKGTIEYGDFILNMVYDVAI